jgi:hypothetical protein
MYHIEKPSAVGAPQLQPVAVLEYLTPRQAANMTGFSLRALEALRAKRTGPSYIKVGRAKNGPIRYHIEDVRAWMQKHREVTHVA